MKTDNWIVPVKVSVPTGMGATEVQIMLEEMIGEALSDCDRYITESEDRGIREACESILRCDFSASEAKFVDSSGTDLDCSVDVDDAHYIGDRNDGVYFQVFEDENGKFWMSAIVDCNSGGFCENLVDRDGPYDTEDQAACAGQNVAFEWCGFNDILVEKG